MSLADLDEVVALESASQPRPWSEGIFRDELSAENRVYVIAEDDRLVGFGGIMVLEDEAHVTNLLVAADRRGRGTGRRMMVSLIESAIDAGARHLTLEVRKENMAARALYAGLGLAPVGIRPDYFGDDDALILWAHDIDDPRYLKGLR
jgi:ribosomal-protein-alanine N-acetyltransferase